MSTIKVTVIKGTVEEKSGTFKDNDGKDREYTTRKQKAKIEAAGFAYPFDVRLEDGERAYPEGEYLLDVDSMLQVNKGVAVLGKYTKLIPANKARAAA